jgi:hypothetical protein
MKHRGLVPQSTIVSVLLMLSITSFFGCSIIGFTTGAVIDGSKQDKDTLYVGASLKLTRGEEVRIFLVDSTIVDGAYHGVEALDSLVYAPRYARFLQSGIPNATFPRLGDTLLVTLNTGTSQRSYSFQGFGTGYLDVKWLGQSQIGRIAFRQIRSLENPYGVNLHPEMFESMSNTHQLPSDLCVVVKTKIDTGRIPLDDIRFIEKTNSKRAKWVGLGAGFVIDAAIITVSLVSFSHSMSNIGSGLRFN